MRIFILLIWIIAVSLAAKTSRYSYNEEEAKIYAVASGLAYCKPVDAMAENCNLATIKAKEHDMKPLHTHETYDEDDNISSIFIRREKEDELVIAFSGTREIPQLLNEARYSYDIAYDIHPEIGDSEVLKYFYLFYKNVFRNDLREGLKKYTKQYPTARIVFTGHSLGGALAVHAATDTILSGWADESKVLTYTFGQPRVGDYLFGDILRDRGIAAFRVIHDDDIVPHLPPWFSFWWTDCQRFKHSYHHNPTEVWYTNNMESYRVCSRTDGEDEDWSNSESFYNF